jgi:hypothetical protein
LAGGVFRSAASRASGSARNRAVFIPHRTQFGLVLDHCLLGLTQLLFLLEQRFGATMRLIGIHTQYRNSLVKPREDHRPLDPRPPVFGADQTGVVAGELSFAGKFV